MAKKETLAKQAVEAQEVALEVVAEHGSAACQARIALIPLERAHARFPEFLTALHAELLAALAEIIQAQDARIYALENPPAASPEAAPEAAKESAKK